MTTAGPPVFVSYSHRDQPLLRNLLPYLESLQRDEIAKIWVDTGLRPGTWWHREIEAAVDGASVAVLLISQSFLVSHFIYAEELPRILRRQQDGKVEVLPVFLSPSSVASTSIPFLGKDGTQQRVLLSDFQGVGSPDKTIREFSRSERERKFLALQERIRELAGSKYKTSAAPGEKTEAITARQRIAERKARAAESAEEVRSDAAPGAGRTPLPALAPRAIILDRHYAYQLTSYSSDSAQQHSNQLPQKYHELFDILTLSVILFDIIYLEQHHVSSIDSALSEDETEASLDLFTPISLAEPVGSINDIAALEDAIRSDLEDSTLQKLISDYYGRRPMRPANNKELVVYINTVLHHARVLEAAIFSRQTRMPLFLHKCKVEDSRPPKIAVGASRLSTVGFQIPMPKLRNFGELARLQEEPTRNAFRARLWERVRERTEDQAGDKAAVAQIEGQTMAGTPAEFSRKFEIAVANSSPSGGLGQRQFLILDN